MLQQAMARCYFLMLPEEACGIKSYNAVKFCKLHANMKREALQGYKFLKQQCRYDLILN
jgi:hypothetical protein